MIAKLRKIIISKQAFCVLVAVVAILMNVWVICFHSPAAEDQRFELVKKIFVCGIFDVAVILLIWHIDNLIDILNNLLGSRALIWSLSKNDFKTKFAGSYFGIVWALAQPVVLVIVYWFVFQKAFHATAVDDCPFILWLIMGLVPWFYFSDALTGGTNTLVEYSYLVKKVVFNIDILPIIKMISNVFVHLFFIVVATIIFAFYGRWPGLYNFQLIYYLFCMMAFVLSLSYLTSAVVVFFRDLSQIIGIALQVLIWITPVMWNISMVQGKAASLLMLNPLYYIVSGYRNSVIWHIGFWHEPYLTVYFWGITILFFVLGTTIFRKLKVHYADVL